MEIAADCSGYSVDPELIWRVCSILQVDPKCHADFVAELERIGSVFAGNRDTDHLWGVPGEQRQAIRALVQSLEETLMRARSVAPEYKVAIEAMRGTQPLSFRDHLFTRLQSTLAELQDAAIRFDQAYEPKRNAPTDVILEEAVRAMIAVFTSNGLERPAVIPGRKGQDPKARNSEAVAIVELLRGIDKRTGIGSIVNMIVAVKGGRPPSGSHLDEIWHTTPGYDVDLSLRGHRR